MIAFHIIFFQFIGYPFRLFVFFVIGQSVIIVLNDLACC